MPFLDSETLLEKQQRFVWMISGLIDWAHKQGYEITFGDAYRDPRAPYGHPKSLHRLRLAIDLNLFKDGKYLTTTEDYKILGEKWEECGGTWGGRFGEKDGSGGSDGNHFSLEHEGVK